MKNESQIQKKFNKLDTFKIGNYSLLLCSYCGSNNNECSDKLPCPECLEMCNVAKIENGGIKVIGGYKYLYDQRNPKGTG